ncbi:Lrp/AsnC family transcriptional regulator [Stappia sp. P2PMeth1]|uniref:Lrp/AsnC family transcriptional regulator n=1 Tax=Stappia sp. P2PMeth1 TaxID=2003586 RepID=UPI0016445609|nr:Lrp/AsnC family transcriptional regulator [Stappia sp. P2PMeth1]
MGDKDVFDNVLSPFDRRLIQLLSEDARRSNTELAALLDVSRMTVKNRIDRLLDRGVIERFTITLADEGRGKQSGESAFFHMKLRRPFCKLVHDTIQNWPELIGAWSIAGGTDMTILVQAAGYDRLEEIRDRLARHPEVEIVWTAMILRQWTHKSSRNRDYHPNDGPDRLDLRMREIGSRISELNDGLVQAP